MKNNKSAIIFASYIPNRESLWVGIDILNKLVECFIDHDIYVGVNNSCPEWIKCLEVFKSILSIKYCETPGDKLIDSDASAFQTALGLYKEDNVEHNLVWFIHSKGVTSDCHEFRKELYNVFFEQRTQIESFFAHHPTLGLFSPYMHHIVHAPNYIEHNLRTILVGDEYKTCSNWSCFYAWYVIRGSIVNKFVKEVNPSFFERHLLTLGVEQKFDRYFFERDFPMIVEKFGYGWVHDPEYSWLKKYSKKLT